MVSTAFLIIVAGMPVYAKGNAIDADVMVADAICHAEGGAKAHYLYGIRSVQYKNIAEARRICIRTVKHARRDWNGKGDFIVFLGSRYCPIGANNDPKGVNKNWVKNVKYWLQKGAR